MTTLPRTLDEARALHREVAARPVDVARLLEAAAVALGDQRLDDAETLLAGALVAAPDRVESWRLVGRFQLECGEPDLAEDAFRQALDLADDEASALDLASLLASEGRFEEADGLASALALEAEDPRIQDRAEALATAIADRRKP